MFTFLIIIFFHTGFGIDGVDESDVVIGPVLISVVVVHRVRNRRVVYVPFHHAN